MANEDKPAQPKLYVSFTAKMWSAEHRSTGVLCLHGVRLTTTKQTWPHNEEDGDLEDSEWFECDPVRFHDSAHASGLWSGDKVHLVLHYHDNYSDMQLAFTDLGAAQRFFDENERDVWQSLQEWRNNNPNDDFVVIKLGRWHYDMLERRKNSRYAFERPDKGDTLWLVTLQVDGPAVDLGLDAAWPVA